MAPQTSIAALRRRISTLESGGFQRSEPLANAPAVLEATLCVGHPDIDGCFAGGGFEPGSHQFGGRTGDPAAARGFAAMLLARYLAPRPLASALIVQEASALREAGPFHGPGLHALGLDPGRLVFLQTQDGANALRAVNEALRARAPDVLLLDLWDGAGLADLSVTRRFNLAARKAGVFVLMTAPDLSATSAALTRWTVASAPSFAAKRRLGAPAFSLDLVRNRHGRTGRWILEWNSHDRVFQSFRPAAGAPSLRSPAAVAASVAAPAFDRSGQAGRAAAVLPAGAYRQAG